MDDDIVRKTYTTALQSDEVQGFQPNATFFKKKMEPHVAAVKEKRTQITNSMFGYRI